MTCFHRSIKIFETLIGLWNIICLILCGNKLGELVLGWDKVSNNIIVNCDNGCYIKTCEYVVT